MLAVHPNTQALPTLIRGTGRPPFGEVTGTMLTVEDSETAAGG